MMRNQWQHHRFSLTANPASNLMGPIEVRADFSHRPFNKNIANFIGWKGLIYTNFSNTDLVAWKSYIDYPFDVQHGIGDVRAWLAFDQTRIVSITADLKLADVKTGLRADLPPLDLKSVSGRFAAREIVIQDSIPRARANVIGHHEVKGYLFELTNFGFESLSGMLLAPTTLTAHFVPAYSNHAEQLHLSTKSLDLTTVARLARYFPFSQSDKRLLESVEPKGQLSNFSVKLQGHYPNFSIYQISSDFTNLAVKSLTINQFNQQLLAVPHALSPIFSFLPGLTNLAGRIEFTEKKGSIYIASKNLLLQLPASFTTPEIRLDLVNLNANWRLQSDHQLRVTLNKFSMQQQDTQAHFYGTHIFPLSSKDEPQNASSTKDTQEVSGQVLSGVIDLTGTISHIDIPTIHRYLPAKTDPDLRHWLKEGLQEGGLNDISVRIKGNLADFPFAKKELLDLRIFHVTGKIDNGKINYLPGVFSKDNIAPYWPILSKIKGQIVFDRASMDIKAESGETDGIPVADVHACIPNLLSENNLLVIDGSASGTAQNMLHYLGVSPVLGWIGNFTQDIKITGNSKLKLLLEIPLAHPLDTKVAGIIQFKDNDIALLKELPLIKQVNGRLDFDENRLVIKALTGNFLGGTVTVAGGTRKDGVVRVSAEGQMTADGLRKAYEQPELENILARIKGKTPYSAVIQVKNKKTEVRVDSTLDGLAVDLPEPINKVASSSLPIHVELISAPDRGNISPAGIREHDEIKLSLGNVVNAHYFRQRTLPSNSWEILRGGIGINAVAPTPDSGLSARINLAHFNVDELKALLPGHTDYYAGKLAKKSSAPLPTTLVTKLVTELKSGLDNKLKNKNVNFLSPKIDFSSYFEPDLISVQAIQLTLFGKKLDHVVLGATRLDRVWQANLDSKQISGHLTWNKAEHSIGHVTARLSSLIIPKTATQDVLGLLQNKNVYSTIPGLDVIAETVELSGKKLGRLELHAKNVNTADSANKNEAIDDWQIDTLRLTNPDAELTAQGKWINGNQTAESGEHNATTKSHTDLKYQLLVTNAGKLLNRLGYENLISGGKGKLSGAISWNGAPYSMDIPSLSGQIQLDLRDGQFLKVDPGAGKLLAVLNLQALPRRLMLDFRDVFSEGFSFDGISGDAQILKGVAKTDNLKMHSATATVLLNGTANISNETQNLQIIVKPEINAGAASVVYGLVVNPVIGAGTFLAQLFLREPLTEAFTYKYKITGPWKEPNIVPLEGD
jgi:uncharacterized protein (TIGR02099 family)